MAFCITKPSLWQLVMMLCSIFYFLFSSHLLTLGDRTDFILPDRKKYVSMDKQYLKSYMDLVIKACFVVVLLEK